MSNAEEKSVKQKLEELQGLVIDKYIKALSEDGQEGKDTVHFRDMSPIISLLNQNSIVEEKGSSTVEEEIAEKVAAAEERRKNNAV